MNLQLEMEKGVGLDDVGLENHVTRIWNVQIVTIQKLYVPQQIM